MQSLGLSDKELALAEGFLGEDDENNEDDSRQREEDQKDRNLTNVMHGLQGLALPSHAVAHAIVPTLVQTSEAGPINVHTIVHTNADDLHKLNGQGQGSDNDLTTPPGWFCPTPASLNPLVLASAKGKDKGHPLTDKGLPYSDMEKMDKFHDKNKAVGVVKAQLRANKHTLGTVTPSYTLYQHTLSRHPIQTL